MESSSGDASLAFKWLVREENSDRAQAISRSWTDDGFQAAAPHLLPIEVAKTSTGGSCWEN